MNLKTGFKALWARFGVEFSLALFLIAPAVAWISGRDVGTAILWATGIVLLAYTIETQGMRLEIVRQNEIAIQPLLMTTVGRREETQDMELILRNIGRGPALFVRVLDATLSAGEGGRLVAEFDGIDCVEAGKDVFVRFRIILIRGEKREEVAEGRNFLANLDPGIATASYDFSILYEDTIGWMHRSVIRMGKGHRLVEHGRL